MFSSVQFMNPEDPNKGFPATPLWWISLLLLPNGEIAGNPPWRCCYRSYILLSSEISMWMKCACKSWKTLLTDPIFIKMHLKNLSTQNPSCEEHSLCFWCFCNMANEGIWSWRVLISILKISYDVNLHIGYFLQLIPLCLAENGILATEAIVYDWRNNRERSTTSIVVLIEFCGTMPKGMFKAWYQLVESKFLPLLWFTCLYLC
jgi:hypothetical protein